MSKPQTDARARGISETLGEEGPMAVLDIAVIIAIITQLLPMIIDCFDPDDGPQAQDYVKKRFTTNDRSNRYRGYDKRLAKSMARNAKRAARKEKSRISWAQAYETAFIALDDIRTGDTATASIAIAENHDFFLI